MKKILVVNAGSSTIKWTVFNKETMEVHASGIADRIFVDGFLQTKFNGEKHRRDVTLDNHNTASLEVVKDFKEYGIIENLEDVEYIGYRVVQGGDIYEKTVIVGDKELQDISDLSQLAPLHNPGAVQAIKAFGKIFPHAQPSATFDTAFHTTIPAIHNTYGIPETLAKELKIKKYGAHGTSHKFITKKLEELLGKDKVNFVNLHIGNGASLCAVKDSKSIDTSMGLTPLAGIMMGTRSGDIDPSIHAYVCKQKGIDVAEFDRILHKESGLKGISGISQDMRDIWGAAKEGNKKAIFTIELYSQKIADYTAIYLNKIGVKADAIVFTAGLAEKAFYVRQSVIDKLAMWGVKLDKTKNEEDSDDPRIISSADSAIPVWVIPTNEELMIATEALEAK